MPTLRPLRTRRPLVTAILPRPVAVTTKRPLSAVIASQRVVAPSLRQPRVHRRIGAHSSALSPGSISETGHTSSTLSFTATDASGGIAPYSYQWSRRLSGVGSFAPLAGQTALTLVDSGLAASTAYDYEITYTDAASASAVATITASTDGVSPSPAYAMSGAMPYESYIVGEVRPAFASFTALSIGAGAPVSFPIASVTFTLTNERTGQTVPGFDAIAASIIAPNPATVVKVAIALDFTPGAANPIAAGAYLATFYASDGLGQICAAEGSIIVQGVGPGSSLMGFQEGGGSG